MRVIPVRALLKTAATYLPLQQYQIFLFITRLNLTSLRKTVAATLF